MPINTVCDPFPRSRPGALNCGCYLDAGLPEPDRRNSFVPYAIGLEKVGRQAQPLRHISSEAI